MLILERAFSTALTRASSAAIESRAGEIVMLALIVAPDAEMLTIDTPVLTPVKELLFGVVDGVRLVLFLEPG